MPPISFGGGSKFMQMLVVVHETSFLISSADPGGLHPDMGSNKKGFTKFLKSLGRYYTP